ncbi:replicative DNA helicase [Bacillus cereus]|uniref:replicative DNA helicase n=1 Tax=Bacillus cereus TaxID=1396 RepID=UPI003D64AC96
MEIQSNYHNIEAERSVLGSVFFDPETINDLIIEPDHFYYQHHVKLMKWFRAMQQAHEPIDLVTITEIAKERIGEVGGISYLMELAESVPTTANLKHYEAIVIDNWKKRRKYSIYAEAMQNVENEGIDAAVKEQIEKIDEVGRTEKFSIKDHLVKKYEKVEQATGEIIGAITGLTELDRMLGGIERKKLIVVPARPSMGKTAFALEVVRGTIQNSTAFNSVFSLEMEDNELTDRMISALANLDGYKVKNPKFSLNAEEWEKYFMAMDIMSKWEENIDICHNGSITTREIRRRVAENKKRFPDKHHIVTIDYLQLITPSGKYAGNRVQEITEISRDLKNIAMDLDCTVIALSQLSRGVEQRQDKRPMMSDIRESGSIEQDADIIAFLYRDDYYDRESDKKNIIDVIIAKNRGGAIGTLEFAYIKEFSKFVNLERRFDNKNEDTKKDETANNREDGSNGNEIHDSGSSVI